MAIESALVILVPEVEVLVGSFRNQYDPSAALGVPAHVTLLYPFKPPHELTAELSRELVELFAKHSAFTVSFRGTKRFQNVLYLPPKPAEPFQRLAEIIAERYPEAPPYGGQFPDIIPHLTVAQISDSRRLEEIAVQFEQVAQGCLPIQAIVREIALMDNESEYWRIRARFSLGAKS